MSRASQPRRRGPSPRIAVVQAPPRGRRWSPLWRSTLAQALAGGALVWLALPPVEAWPLAWLAPIPWLRLARREPLCGGRPYLQLWLAGWLFWLAAVYWLTLPDPVTILGWLALSAYLAAYLPLFIALARAATRVGRVPLSLAAPVVWTGLELARGYLLSGFLMAALGHTQYRWPGLIQVSDLAGGYAVSFVVMWGAACLESALPSATRRWNPRPLVPLAGVLALVLGYGQWRLSQAPGKPGPTVALIQGSIDSILKHDPQQALPNYEHYAQLTRDALARNPQVDLLIWPETMYPWTYFQAEPGAKPLRESKLSPAELVRRGENLLAGTVSEFRKPMLLGISIVQLGADAARRYNSVLALDAAGKPRERYDKVHRVMFGEYVPLADVWPVLYKLTPLPFGLEPGARAVSMTAGGVRYAPTICYENTVPHLVRRHVSALRAAGQEPQVLVNLTNDGWFWGSSELDMHLACAVFRAVECRRPMLIAANTGLSAWIDANGRVRRAGPRRAPAFLIAQPELDSRWSGYMVWGDWPAGLCLALSLAAGVAALWKARLRPGRDSALSA